MFLKCLLGLEVCRSLVLVVGDSKEEPYDEKDGGVCQETSVVASNARAQRLLKAEKTILTAGGMVCVIKFEHDLGSVFRTNVYDDVGGNWDCLSQGSTPASL